VVIADHFQRSSDALGRNSSVVGVEERICFFVLAELDRSRSFRAAQSVKV
jgi:hypothetical protein